VAVFVAVVVAVFVGDLLGRCTGYIIGFASGAVAGKLQAGTDAGVSLGAATGRIAFPVLMLVGWVLVRWRRHHYEATAPWRSGEGSAPPPAMVRHGLLALVGVVLLILWMVPVALGIGLGRVVASAFGSDSGPWATALPALGGILGLALPFIFWRRVR
jgi:hypothetical protein